MTIKVKKLKNHNRINNQGPFFGWFNSHAKDKVRGVSPYGDLWGLSCSPSIFADKILIDQGKNIFAYQIWMCFVAFVSTFKKMYFRSQFPLFLFFIFSTFSVAQSGVCSKDHIAFGAPEKLGGSQLPTYLDIAKHFLFCSFLNWFLTRKNDILTWNMTPMKCIKRYEIDKKTYKL